jgi:hypothetical protein
MFSITNTCSRTAQRALKRPGSLRMIHVEKRLEELGITLPTPSSPRANYNIVCHASGNMLYISGKHDLVVCSCHVFFLTTITTD